MTTLQPQGRSRPPAQLFPGKIHHAILKSMNLGDRLIKRLELVREDLTELYPQLQKLEINWAPSKGMRTIGGQLKEIASTEKEIFARIEGNLHPDFELISQECERQTLNEYITLLNEIRAKTSNYIQNSSEEELLTPLPMPHNWFFALQMAQAPPSELILWIAQHEWYHTGQLTSYLWMNGNNPYDW